MLINQICHALTMHVRTSTAICLNITPVAVAAKTLRPKKLTEQVIIAQNLGCPTDYLVGKVVRVILDNSTIP